MRLRVTRPRAQAEPFVGSGSPNHASASAKKGSAEAVVSDVP
jgi:hypothetical protein